MVLNNKTIDEYVNKKDSTSILNWLLNNPSYLNLPWMLAQNKVVPLTIGSEILVDSDDEKIVKELNRWMNTVNLREKLRQICFQMSLLGKSIAFIERKKPTKDYPKGLLMFKVSNETIMSSVAKVDDIDQMAVIYTNTNKSDAPSLQKIIFKQGLMIVEEFANPDEIRAQDINTEVEKGLQRLGKRQVFETNLDFLPFAEFPNRVMPNIIGGNNNTIWSAIPDWFMGRKLIFDIEDNFQKRWSERFKNQTRVMGQFDPEAIKNLINGTSTPEDFAGDFIIESNNQSYMNGTNGITVIQGDPKLEVYHRDKEMLIKTFYESAGYNYFEKDGNYENQTKSIMNYDLDMSTTKMKQSDIKYRLYKILDLVLNDMGLEVYKNGVRNYTIDFQTTSIVDDIRLIDIVERRLAMGTLDRVRAVQMLDKVPKTIAQEYVDLADKDLDKQVERDIETQNKLNKWDDNNNNDNGGGDDDE